MNRILKKLEPQLVENTKRALIIKGMHTSQSIVDVLKDFSKLLKPNCKVLGRKNELIPFDDGNSLEFLATKNDCSLFIVGSHSKKRTNNLVMVSVLNQLDVPLIELVQLSQLLFLRIFLFSFLIVLLASFVPSRILILAILTVVSLGAHF